jgi:hypothetical protein
MRVRDLATDGLLLLEILDGRSLERDLIIRNLNTSLQEGTRPRDWDHQLVERMLTMRVGSPSDVYANLYGYHHMIDLGQVEAAHQFLDLALNQRSGVID